MKVWGLFFSAKEMKWLWAALKCEKKPIRNPHWQTQGADKVLRGFIVDTFTETEAGLWIPVRETQRMKRGRRQSRACGCKRGREGDSRGGLGLSQTIKAPYVPLLSLSHLYCATQKLFQPMLYRTAIKIHLKRPLTLQPGMYGHPYVHTLAASHLC